MSSKLKIVEKEYSDWIFKTSTDDGLQKASCASKALEEGGGIYPLNYSLVIAHALWMYIMNNTTAANAEEDTAMVKKLLQELMSNSCEGFMSVYDMKTPNPKNYLYVVVDNTRGCYPLLISEDRKNASESRKNAFVYSIGNINTKEIIRIIVEDCAKRKADPNHKWTKALQADILRKIPYFWEEDRSYKEYLKPLLRKKHNYDDESLEKLSPEKLAELIYP